MVKLNSRFQVEHKHRGIAIAEKFKEKGETYHNHSMKQAYKLDLFPFYRLRHRGQRGSDRPKVSLMIIVMARSWALGPRFPDWHSFRGDSALGHLFYKMFL
jgi:hypothetical protein